MVDQTSPEKCWKEAVSERKIFQYNLFQINNRTILSGDEECSLKKCISGNGKFELSTDCILGKFRGEQGSYQLRIHLAKIIKANGLTVRARISNWQYIRYFAIGHTEGKEFRHLKITNPIQDEWLTFSIGYNDLAYGWQNEWQSPNATNIRLYISGGPSNASNSNIEISWAATWIEDTEKFTALKESDYVPNEGLFQSFYNYFKRCNPAIETQARHFLDTGELLMTEQGKSLSWAYDKAQPDLLHQTGTYRYLWHALQPAVTLMVYYVDNQKTASLYAAREFITNWLERSFFTPDNDLKYAWYDHGTAERLIAFLFMYVIGVNKKLDKRFIVRLRYAIFRHTQLLESDAFYTGHQTTRYHNHAWFQDMALIAAATFFPKCKSSARWLARGVYRLKDQLSHLITRDSDYAIFIENSIGYHHGIQRLVKFAGELVTLSGTVSEIPKVASELEAWSSFLRYPDNRSPSQGDTFRIPNKLDKTQIRQLKPYERPEVVILEEAGYAVIKSNHQGKPFMLCIFATSLCKTHKHEDNLSITLFFDGVEWLIDPSFFSHEYNEKVPSYLLSAEAHNNIWVRDCPYSLEPGCASLSGDVSESSFDILGTHLAYENMRVERQLKGQMQKLYISCVDRLVQLVNAKNTCDAQLVFHFGEGVIVETNNTSHQHELILNHPASDYKLKLVSSGKSMILVAGKNEQNISVAGTSYTTSIPTTSAIFSMEDSDVVEWTLEFIQ